MPMNVKKLIHKSMASAKADVTDRGLGCFCFFGIAWLAPQVAFSRSWRRACRRCSVRRVPDMQAGTPPPIVIS